MLMASHPPPLDVFESLGRSMLFSSFPEADLREVTRFSRVVRLAPDEMLFQENQACRAIYYVVDGLVKLYVMGPDRHEKTVEFIEPGQTFAEAAMFSGQGYPVTAMALDDTELVAVDAYSLLRYLRLHPELNWQMLAVLSRRLHQLVGQIRSVSLHNAEQRVASYLLEYYDPEEPRRPVGHIPARRSELASVMGLTTETLCRVIANFRRHGWITTVEREIVVQDPEALRELLSHPRR